MTGCIIFLPGILGSRLTLDGEEIWPPTATEAITGYGRIAALMDDRVEAGRPIDRVCLMPVYRPLLDDLASVAGGLHGAPHRAMHAFGYDWRIDLRDAARDIARRIDELPAADRQEIHFVGHSMGNFVIRILLESGEYDTRSWFGAVKTLVSLAAPHRGAPAAIAHIMGMKGSSGLTAGDICMMAADPRFPSLCQLLPHPVIPALRNMSGGLMDTASACDAILSVAGAGNLQKAADVASLLARQRRPEHVDYICLAGSSHDTCIRMEIRGGTMQPVEGRGAGDGTVPLWSAIEPAVAHHVVAGGHSSFFGHEQIRSILYRALGARLPGVAFTGRAGKPLVSLHMTQMVWPPGSAPELLLVAPRMFRRLAGEIVIGFAENAVTANFPVSMRVPVTFEGPETGHLALHLPVLRQPGFYCLCFEGTHETGSRGRAGFAVSIDHERAGE